MIITSHMQHIIQIYPCLLKLAHKQDTILKIGDFSTKNYDFPQKPLFQILPCKNPSKIMIITSRMQKIIQIHPCLLSYRINKKVWRRTVAISISPTAISGRYKHILLNMGAVVIVWLWDL